jgi:glucokinase
MVNWREMQGQQRNYVLALDFGGTKLVAGIVDLHTGTINLQNRIATDHKSAQKNLEQMIQAGKDLLREPYSKTMLGVGISFGGPIEPDRRHIIRSMHIPGWESVALPEIISNAFQLPAVMDNDANLASLGEWRFGFGQGTNHLVYIQVSTGIGAGLILAGHLYRGTGAAGEFGHLTVMIDGPTCTCGKRGCVESFAAGWAIARDGREMLLEQGEKTLLHTRVNGNPALITAQRVAEAAALGDLPSQAIVSRAFTFLGIGIANVINLMSPELVVLGGGLTKAGDLMRQPILNALTSHVIPSLAHTPLAFSNLGDNAPLLGAAALVAQELNIASKSHQ